MRTAIAELLRDHDLEGRFSVSGIDRWAAAPTDMNAIVEKLLIQLREATGFTFAITESQEHSQDGPLDFALGVVDQATDYPPQMGYRSAFSVLFSSYGNFFTLWQSKRAPVPLPTAVDRDEIVRIVSETGFTYLDRTDLQQPYTGEMDEVESWFDRYFAIAL